MNLRRLGSLLGALLTLAVGLAGQCAAATTACEFDERRRRDLCGRFC
jgi:hypothetical protein